MTSGKGVDDRINALIKKKEELFNYGQDIVMAFSPPVVGCLVKNGLKRGGVKGTPGPPWYAHGFTWYGNSWRWSNLIIVCVKLSLR